MDASGPPFHPVQDPVGGTARPDGATLIAFAGVVLLAGGNFVAVRFSNLELPPFWGSAMRFLVAAAIMAVLVRFVRIEWPKGKALSGAALFGVLGFAGTYGLIYWALRPGGVSSGVAAVVFASVPLATLVVAVAFGLERFRLAAVVGAVLAVAGTALVFLAGRADNVPLTALIAAVAASLCAAASGVVVKRAPRSHPLAFNAVAMAVGGAILLIASFAYGEERAMPALTSTWTAFTYLIASSIGLFVLMVWVIHRWTASAAAYALVLAPFVTVPLAAALAGETVGALFAAGAVVVLGGTYIGALHRSAPPAQR